MDTKIVLYGNEKDLINILKSHIQYLEACGHDRHIEIDQCNYFLRQLE